MACWCHRLYHFPPKQNRFPWIRTHARPVPSPPGEILTESFQTSCRRRGATAIARSDTHNRLLHLLFVASSWKTLINPHPPRPPYRLQLLLHLNWLLRPSCPSQNNPLEPQRQEEEEEEEEHSNKGSFIPSSENSLLPWKLKKSLNFSSGPDLHRNHSLNCSSDPDLHRIILPNSLSLSLFFLSPTRAAHIHSENENAHFSFSLMRSLALQLLLMMM